MSLLLLVCRCWQMWVVSKQLQSIERFRARACKGPIPSSCLSFRPLPLSPSPPFLCLRPTTTTPFTKTTHSTPHTTTTEKSSLESLTNTLGVPLGTAKAMVFKKRALLQLAPDEILNRVRQVADIVGVTTDQAIEMVTIQPGLLFDTQVCLRGGGGPFEGVAAVGEMHQFNVHVIRRCAVSR